MIKSIYKGINEGLQLKDSKSYPAVSVNSPMHSQINLKDAFIKTHPDNAQTNIDSLKNKVCSFLGTILKTDNKIAQQNPVTDIVNNFSNKIISLNKTHINVQNIQDLINTCLPNSGVTVKDMSEFKNKSKTNTYAAYEVTTNNDKNLYVNFTEDVTNKKQYAKLIQALVHEFTHAVQRDSNKQLGRLHNIIKQRGMLNTINSTFFQLELDLFRYNNSMKQYKPKKEIPKLETKELFEYLDVTREKLNKAYQEILLNSLITRENVDRELAIEFFISELRDEAQAYKLGLSAYKKTMRTEGKFNNYELFHVLLSDMADYLANHYKNKPIFVDKSNKNYSETASLFIDIELDFGKNTILKHFKELENNKCLDKKPDELYIFDLFTDFSRESLNDLYTKVIHDNFSKYNKIPDPESLKALKTKFSEIARLTKKHTFKVKEKYNIQDEAYNIDYIPLMYKDFTNYISQQK